MKFFGIIKSFFERFLDEIILVGVSYFLFVVATNIQSGWLFFMISFILGLLIFGFLFSLFNLRHLRITRRFPEIIDQDGEVGVTLHFFNDSFLPKFFIFAEDSFPCLFPGEKPPRLLVPYISPRGRSSGVYSRKAYLRGIYYFNRIKIETTGILGFFRLKAEKEADAKKIIVLPKPLDIKNLNLDNRAWKTSAGERTFNYNGRSYDFAGIREYEPGQEMRFVHWPSSARFEKLMIKEFNEISVGSLSIIIDTQQGTGFGAGRETTTEYLVKTASTLIKEASRKNCSFDIISRCNGAVRVDNKLSFLKAQLKLAEIQPYSEIPLDEDLPEINRWKISNHIYVLKVFPFENLGSVKSLISRGRKVTVLFFDYGSFGDGETGSNGHSYQEQLESLKKMGIDGGIIRKGDSIKKIIGGGGRSFVG